MLLNDSMMPAPFRVKHWETVGEPNKGSGIATFDVASSSPERRQITSPTHRTHGFFDHARVFSSEYVADGVVEKVFVATLVRRHSIVKLAKSRARGKTPWRLTCLRFVGDY
jgi:hypothetical protein